MTASDNALGGKLPDPTPGKPAEAPRLELQRRQELEQIVRANSNDPDAFMELANIYLAEHRPLEGKRVLEQAKRIFPGDMKVEWAYEEAVLARALQQFREANDLASRVNSSEADSELEKAQLGWIDRRIEICRARLKRDPSLDHLRVVLAEALSEDGQFEQAIETLQAIGESHVLSPQVHFIRGRCRIAQGRHAEALACLRRAVMRREVPAPLKIRVAGLRLLCETASQLGVTASLQHYRDLLKAAESEVNAASVG